MKNTNKKGLRVCTTVVSTDGRAELKSNDERIAMAKQLLAARPGGSELVVLPAGYLRARSEGEVREVAAPVIEAARRAGVAVVLGVDAGPKRGTARGFSLPYFLIGWAPGTSKASVWRQRSVTSTDAGDAPQAALAEARALQVGAFRVAPIACGEVFSPMLREGVAKLKPRVAVLVAHTASGARHWAGQRCLARLGTASVRAVHASGGARDVLCRDGDELPPVVVEEVAGITASCFVV